MTSNLSNLTDEPLVIYRSHRSELMSILLFLVLFAASIYASMVFPWATQRIPLGSMFGAELYLPLPLFAIIPLALLGRILHGLYNYRYILCDEYVLEVKGLLSLRRRSIRLNYVHIRGVQIDESLLQQFLGIGDLQILGITGEHGEPRIEMKGVANPRALKDLIQQNIQRSVQGLKSVAMDS